MLAQNGAEIRAPGTEAKKVAADEKEEKKRAQTTSPFERRIRALPVRARQYNGFQIFELRGI